MPRYNVAIVFGGRSPEHEVSIITAHQVMGALSEQHNIIPIYVTKAGAWLTGSKFLALETFTKGHLPGNTDGDAVSIELAPEQQFLVRKRRWGTYRKPYPIPVDVIFPLIHGVHGEDGTLQGLLRMMNIPYVGAGVCGSAIGMDKIMMKAVLAENDLPILSYVWFDKQEWLTAQDAVVSRIEENLPYPVFVKPANSGSSIGVVKAEDREGLESAITLASQYDLRIVAEQGLDNAKEINCSVLGNHQLTVSVCEQPMPADTFLSFDDKYIHQDTKTSGMAGADRLIPAPISEELTGRAQELARKTFRALDCRGIARVDFLIGEDDEPYVNEINTIPGSLSFYLWQHSDIDFTQLTDQLIELALEVHANRSQLTYTYPSNILGQMSNASTKLKLGNTARS